MNDKLINLMADVHEEETLAIVRELIRCGTNPYDILDDARSGMELVGKRFETGEYFMPDLMMAGEILKGISDIVRPLSQPGKASAKKGKVLIGTVAGDIHDFGKNVVAFMLHASGYDVLDVGIDAPVETFLEKVEAFKPQVIGLSGFLTLALDSMLKTVEALERSGIRDSVKIMIGGGQTNDEVRRYVRADAYGKDAIAAVNLCRYWLGR